MEAPNLVQFENGAYFDLGEFSNLTLNQMNFSGGSAALVDTYQSKRIFAKGSIFCSSFEKMLLFLLLPLFFAKSVFVESAIAKPTKTFVFWNGYY